MKNIKLQNNAQILNELYDGSACTMLGYMPEELHLYINELKENGYLNDEFTVYETSGEELNSVFDLTNPFPNDLNVFIISLDDMKNISKFAVGLRFRRGYRWLDDVVDNARRES